MKPFRSIDEQIEILKNRNLKIVESENAKDILRQTNYYSLINGYKNIFLCKERSVEEDFYDDGVSLDDIMSLYNLDRALRKEYLEALEDIEEVISTNLAYLLAEKYGEQKKDYLNYENFRDGKVTGTYSKHKKRKLRELEILLNILDKTYHSNDHPMKHYRIEHKNVPPWILMKGLTFRNKFYLYKLLRDDDKKVIISRCLRVNISEVTEDTKEFFMVSFDLMVTYRNWIAHGNRFFSHKTKTELPYDKNNHNSYGINVDMYSKGQGRNDVYALSIAISYFFQNNGIKRVESYVSIKFYLNNYQKNNEKYYYKVLKELGFPIRYYYNLTGLNDNW